MIHNAHVVALHIHMIHEVAKGISLHAHHNAHVWLYHIHRGYIEVAHDTTY